MLYGALSGQTFSDTLHDPVGPSGAERDAVFQEIYVKRRGTTRGASIEDYARRSVEAVRQAVFPVQGLT